MISAELHLDSINEHGDRLSTFICRVPKQLLQELNTHRVFSRNAASSRSVSVDRVIEQVENDPFIPPVWGMDNKGKMYHEKDIAHPDYAMAAWLTARDYAVHWAKALKAQGVHRQWVNALLEPFVTVPWVVSSTEWENFFTLRTAPDARPTIRILAEMMQYALNNSTPKQLKSGDMHVPFIREGEDIPAEHLIHVAVARIARVSYANHDKAFDIEKDIKLFNQLKESGHWSPFEHIATADQGNHRNFVGWRQLREDFEA